MRLRCACGADYDVTAKSHPSNERERRLCVGCGRPLDRIASTRVFEFKFVSNCQMWGGIVTKGGAGLCSFVGGYDLPID